MTDTQRTDDDAAEIESIVQEIMEPIRGTIDGRPGGRLEKHVREVLLRRVRVAEVAARATEPKTPPNARTADLCPATVWPYTENNMCVMLKGHPNPGKHKDAKDRWFNNAGYIGAS